MAQNLWKLGGKPTSFNPLTVGYVDKSIPLAIGAYVVKITARSAKGSGYLVQVGNGVPFLRYTGLTSVKTTYEYKFEITTSTNLLIFRNNDAVDDDIIIDNIEVIKQALPQLPNLVNLQRSRRASGFSSEGSFTNEKILSLSKVAINGNPATKQATATVRANFDGKVSGSTDAIPHVSKRDTNSFLMSPTTLTTELTTSFYSQISKQDDNAFPQSHYVLNGNDQIVFSFDLIRLMTDRFGSEFFSDCVDTAAKVNKLKTIISKIQADWWGFGSTVLSNFAGTTDFTGKIVGSTVENANDIKGLSVVSKTLQSPAGTWANLAQGAISLVSSLNGSSFTDAHTGDGYIVQTLFSFNLIEYVKRKYGFMPDVAWLKANITKLTANWHGWGTNVQANALQKTDFTGKVAGSTVENANEAKFELNPTTLLAPSAQTVAPSQAAYDLIKTLDGSTWTRSTSANTAMGQVLFSFNLIEHVQRKYSVTVPGATLADKVNWLKANISTLTANWHGFGTNTQANPVGTTNFASKVQGSVVENPNSMYYRTGSTLVAQGGTAGEGTTGDYTSVSTLNGTYTSWSVNTNGYMVQQLFSFNLIEYVQRKYSITIPGADTAAKVAWLKANIDVNGLAFNWYGFGSSPTGNKANVTLWSTTAWNGYVATNTASSPTKIAFIVDSPSVYIQSDGFVHFVAYAEASNGTTPSVINTDFVELQVSLKAGGNKATLAVWSNYQTGVWELQNSGTQGAVAKQSVTSAGGYIPFHIQNDGFVYFLAYADPSNGISPSAIQTDFVELEVTLKAGGNKATVRTWNNNLNDWDGTVLTHTNGTVTKLAQIWTTAPAINAVIDTNGFAHFLANADPSNGISPSTISTDYVSLDVEVDAGSNKAYFTFWRSNDNTWYPTPVTHTSGTVSGVSHYPTSTYPSGARPQDTIDANGFFHMLAYADPSNGVKPSTINTDYAQIWVDVNASEAGYDTWVDADTSRQLPKLSDNILNAYHAYPLDTSKLNLYYGTITTTGPTFAINTPGVVEATVTSTGDGQGLRVDILEYKPFGKALTFSADIEATADANYVVMLYDEKSGATAFTQFIKAGEKRRVSVTKTIDSTATSANLYVYKSGTSTAGLIFKASNFSLKENGLMDMSPGRNKKKTLNFLGKVAGSKDSVPHVASARTSPILVVNPSTAVPGVDVALTDQAGYNVIGKQDGSVVGTTITTTGAYSQQLFEFDLSHLGLSLADLKAALRKLTITWVGWGQGDNAGVQTNGAKIREWNPSISQWESNTSNMQNTASAPSLISSITWQPSAGDAGLRVDNNQKVYILASSLYPAGAASSSSIYTDYVKLDIELADYVDYVRGNIVKIKQTDPSKVKLFAPRVSDVIDIDYLFNDPRVKPKKNLVPPFSDGGWRKLGVGTAETFTSNGGYKGSMVVANDGQTMGILVPCDAGKTYYYSMGKNPTGRTDFVEFYAGSAFIGGVYGITSDRAFTTPAGTTKMDIYAYSSPGYRGVMNIEELMIAEGSTPQDFEPYQLTGGYKDIPQYNYVPGKNILTSWKAGNTAGANTTTHVSTDFLAVSNASWTFQALAGVLYWVDLYDASKAAQGNTGGYFSGTNTFALGANIAYVKVTMKRADGSNFSVSEVSQYKPQFELGAAATAYEDFKLVPIPAPSRYRVPKKNWLNKEAFTTTMTNAAFAKRPTGLRFDYAGGHSHFALLPKIQLVPNKTFVISGEFAEITSTSYTKLHLGKANNNDSNEYADIIVLSGKFSRTFTTDASGVAYLNGYTGINGGYTINNLQIEAGAASDYEDFQLVNKPSNAGMAMDGVNSALVLPSTAFDAVEIDCLIDAKQNYQYPFLLDARTGASAGFINYGGFGNTFTIQTDINEVYVNGNPLGIAPNNSGGAQANIPMNQRIKVKAVFKSVFTDDLSVFHITGVNGNYALKGTIFGIKCYLNGQVVKEYDATDLANLSAGKLLPKVKDLVPDFEDAAWNFHANAKVLGKTFMRLDATGTAQTNIVEVPAVPNANYFVQTKKLPAGFEVNVYAYDIAGNPTYLGQFTSATATSMNITTPSTCVKLRLSTWNSGAGAFEFGKPELYQLDGTEAQVFGSPLPKVKTPRRVLNNIR